ncbi:MAG: lasso peptide biosynthesis B2 protein [Gemmatimonadaceae bacterium]|jgi:hypothetical protein|nr:lasso peptide biosynthesis B2 protein [Gemmatimonadaceae bacterium]
MLAGRAVGDLVETGGLASPSTDRPSAPPLAAPDRAVVGHWRSAVDRALALLPGDRRCLVRATALRRCLVAAGLDAAVRVGVRRTPAGLDAHAWVEVAGRAVGEDPAYLAAFAPLDGVTIR